jgi:transposase-like protein
MPKPQRDPAREQFWRQAIADQQSSGRTIRDFCRERQLTEPSFHYWQRALRKRDAAATSPSTPPAFVPVTLIPTPSAAAIEVRCPSGHVVTIAPAEAALRNTLCELFAALATEDAAC